MSLEIKIPSPGESISEVELTSWFVEDGALVNRNQEIGEIESEKATLPLIASDSGQLKILVGEGETVKVGTVVASIDTSVEVPEVVQGSGAAGVVSDAPGKSDTSGKSDASVKSDAPGKSDAPAKEGTAGAGTTAAGTPEAGTTAARSDASKNATTGAGAGGNGYEKIKATPVARQIMEKENLELGDIMNGLRKITAADVKKVIGERNTSPDQAVKREASRNEDRVKVSQLRKKISERLVSVKNDTAMLTTFNEADMSPIMAIRKEYQEMFVEKHGIKLGFMSFFTKAVTLSLDRFPQVNSYLDGEEVVTPHYCDVGIAVQTEKGLMVPVIRNAESLGLAELEMKIAELASLARKARLGINEMTGGTFTISNGGIYGSMLSTPILNPPQSGILGMHNIIERPVAIRGKVEIRPMMYLALSYDHRVIDGKDSVGFLKSVKEYIEDPSTMIFGGRSPEEYLLEI